MALIAVTAICFSSCKKTPPDDKPITTMTSTQAAMKYIQGMMKEHYFWNETAPYPNYMNYSNIEKFFKESLVKQDRWSWMTDGKSFTASETGVYTSYGASLGQAHEYYKDQTVYIRYVFKDSPFDRAGITRGWSIEKINGVDTEDLLIKETFNDEFYKDGNTFTFKDTAGNLKEMKINKSKIQATSILKVMVFDKKDYAWLNEPVGYINYLSFNYNMIDEVKSAVAVVKNSGAKHLILDLRYNGGGNIKASDLLASLIANKGCDGKLLVRKKHNPKHSELDNDKRTMSFIQRTPESLDLDDIYVISGHGTASASEIIINGLKPLMNVIQVGQKTYGKPNGMYVMQYPPDIPENKVPDYVFLPICFYSVNSLGQGDYDNGLVPDHYRADRPNRDWADDDLVVACLKKIATGSYPELPKITTTKAGARAGAVLQTDEQKPGYGLCIADMPVEKQMN